MYQLFYNLIMANLYASFPKKKKEKKKSLCKSVGIKNIPTLTYAITH